jgi:cellulose biosynthesis protein BcsQ
MQVIEFKSKKGGVGKSTEARETASMLASLGCWVLLIDASEQANDDILENQGRAFPATLKECFKDGVTLKAAARQVRKNLWMIPGTRDHEEVNDTIRRERYPNMFKDMIDELRKSLKPPVPFDQRFEWWHQERVPFTIFQLEKTSREEFSLAPECLDFVIIDADASTQDELTLNIWNGIDGIFIPFEPTEFDWQSYHQMKQDLQRRYARRPTEQPPILGILPNKVLHQANSATPLVYLKTIFRDCEEQVFRPVHFSKLFGETLNLRISSLEHPLAATDRAVRELAAISLEILGYPGDLSGLKICNLCAEQLAQAMKEQEEAAS